MGFKEMLARRLITVVLVFAVVVGLGWAGRPDPEPIGCFAWERAFLEMRSDRGGITAPDEMSLEAILDDLGGTWPDDCTPIVGPMYGSLSSECRAWRRTVQAEGRGYRGLGSEERSLAAAIRSNAGSKPDGCPIPTHL